MTDKQNESNILFLILSICIALVGISLLLAAMVNCPLILERWILLDGELDSNTARTSLYLISVIMTVASIATFLGAKKMWYLHRVGTPSRKAILVLMTMTISIVLSLVIAEVWLLLTFKNKANLYSMLSDGLWIYFIQERLKQDPDPNAMAPLQPAVQYDSELG